MRHFLKPASFQSWKPLRCWAFSLLSADILQANDSLTQVINQYRQLVKGEDVSKDGVTTPTQPSRCRPWVLFPSFQMEKKKFEPATTRCFLSKSGGSSSALVDLMGLNTSASTAPSNPEASSLQNLAQNTGVSLLDDELVSLGEHKKTQLACKSKGRLLRWTF